MIFLLHTFKQRRENEEKERVRNKERIFELLGTLMIVYHEVVFSDVSLSLLLTFLKPIEFFLARAHNKHTHAHWGVENMEEGVMMNRFW